MTTETHTSMTGLESCFEAELARADHDYVDPDLTPIGQSHEPEPAPENEDSPQVESAMHLGS